jgi:rubrerythrin
MRPSRYGAQVPHEHRAEVSRWREIILGIAKEEMGHLMTVQIFLRCLGGPLNLDREDFHGIRGSIRFHSG